VLIDGTVAPVFARRVLDDIKASNFADVVCYVRNTSVPDRVATDQPGIARRLARALARRAAWSTLGYRTYLRWFDSRYRFESNPARDVDCADVMAGVEILDVAPIASGFVDRIRPPDVALIRARRFDVILRFGFRILHGDILTAARHGIWSFHHGDSDHYRGGPPYVWEIIERNPVSGAVLQILSEQLDGGQIIAKALFATTPTLSASDNAFAPFWGTQHFVIRCLHALHTLGDAAFAARIAAPQPYAGNRSVYRPPSNSDVARWLIPEVCRRAARRVTRVPARVHWRIALRRAHVLLHENPSPAELASFRLIESPPDTFWADPFLIERDGVVWLFFESFDRGDGKAVLRCGRVGGSGDVEDVRTILTRDYHLSYPHVFAYEGEMFMVPESADSGTVDLYRARHFPHDWVFECTLLRLRAVDSTLFAHGGMWWMLSSPMTVLGHIALTHVWCASSPVGRWRLASDAPLSFDVRSARCAGSVFPRGTELWRPSQDCSGRYGRALVFSRIDELARTPRETIQHVIEPGWRPGITGTHSYSAAGGWEAIDARSLERM